MSRAVLSEDALTPPAAVAANAARGLELRERFGRGGTEVGVRRAQGLSAREPIDGRDLTAIYSYFARHAVDRRPDWDAPDRPTAGYIAWMLWGGDEGRRWAEALRARSAETA